MRRYQQKYGREQAVFRLFDTFLRIFVTSVPPSSVLDPGHVRKVLIANAGQLGDVVFSTGVVAAVKASFPAAEIGVLAGSWTQAIFRGNPLVQRHHLLDHWYSNRASLSKVKKLLMYARQRKRVIAEIREQGYDVAIDVRMWFPNFIPVLWSAGIPCRVGFDRVGFGPLLTHVGTVKYGGVHEVDSQVSLVGLLSSTVPPPGEAVLSLPPGGDKAGEEVRMLVGDYGAASYRVLHMGSSTPTRDWPIEKWCALTMKLEKSGHLLVFTGVGLRERFNIDAAIQGSKRSINACDRLSWGGLVELVRGAQLVYSTETSVGHVASAVNTPVVAMYGGTAEPARWRPYGQRCRVVGHRPACFPCLNHSGCEHMACVRELQVDTVWAAGEELVQSIVDR